MNDLSPEAFATENGAMATGDSSHATDMNDLSPEVQLHVMNFLSLQDKLHLRQTNHRWLHLVHSSSAELRRDLQVAALKGLARTLDQDSLLLGLFSCASIRACQKQAHTDFIRRKLDAILQDPDCFTNGITLAFHCKHSYSAEQFSHSPNLSSLLKGFDALVHDAATSLGLKTSLQCFFCLPLSEDKIELCEKAFLVCKSFPQNVNVENFVVGRDYSEYTLLKFLRYRFQPRLLVDAIPPADPQLRQRKREERIVKAFLAGRHRKYTEEDARRDYQRLLETETNEMKKLNVLPKKAVQWCTDKPDKAADLLVAVTAAYGNEPSTECFYASAMLFVGVPPRTPTNEQNILPSCLQ